MSQTIKKAAEDMREIVEMLSGGAVIYTGIVKEVNTGDYTCKVVLNENDEDNVTEGVFVNAALEVTSGMILIPAVDSVVWVAELDGGGNMGIVKCSVLDGFEVRIGNAWIIIRDGGVSIKAGDYKITVDTESKVKINGDAFGGLVKVMELVTKLNNLEYDLNTLKQIFVAWIVAPGDGGAALKTLAASWASDFLTSSTDTELKSENTTHG
ncbi:hypothetical protein CJD36_019830 [Flavipsychrobacter stenotrophus]|uniref:Uncharacterized protein n=1 Tax=Flavipsychrobacter stenotrophus TaxID=2077091 RepID=A0A2S7SRF5_9BACT|nr:hypothetical protein [Flavipsychrobacter stenotrophus]PQJ09492.1 hypothetical protein CJD36_019830 [Flavipsychrobacter stenotrophus]